MRTGVTIALTFVVGSAFGFLVSQQMSDQQRLDELAERVATLEAPRQVAVSPPPRAVPPAARVLTDVSIEGAPVRGPQDAAVTIVEFSDFQCPFCSRVHPTLEKLLATYPDNVRLVFKHNPLPMHADAPLAHRASIAADQQGRFWEMHDKIFSNIRDLSRPTLLRYADELRLDVALFTRDLDSQPMIDKLERDIAESSRLGINGTPTFFINGKIVSGAQPFENFRALIERELAKLGG